ncbi:MAG: hypothetical protein LBL87_05370 [Ruminococcus sp.]|jgi:hypothetical protein|nr:hypothetical protein [Ruminococcus sp.]
MGPLIKVTSVPIKLQFNITNPKMELNEEYEKAAARMPRVSRVNDDTIKADPVKINADSNQDTFDNAAGDTLASYTYSALAGFKEVEGADPGVDIDSLESAGKKNVRAQAASHPIESVLAKLSSGNKNNVVNFQNNTLSINFAMDDFSGNMTSEEVREQLKKWNFIPGEIEISIEQYPDVQIEYVGGIRYFPASSDPDYVPLEEQFNLIGRDKG